jgi:peroxiredoxin
LIMKQLITIFFALITLVIKAQTTTIKPGTAAPDFALNNVDGKQVSFDTYKSAKGFIIVFTCNTCPYAKLYEQRIIDLNNRYASAGFPVIAINPNDPAVSPADSFDEMKEKASDRNYKFPYLFDEAQTTTNAYGAKNTPHIFLVKKSSEGNVIAYTGAIDNDAENTKSNKVSYVEDAIAAIMNNKEPEIATTKAIGCSVKRKRL